MSVTTPTDGREARGARTRRRLLRAARSAFAKRGYGRASVREIARQAGVHPALVTYHFHTKRDLHLAAVKEAMEALGERMLAEAAQGDDARDAARRALGAYLDHLEDDPGFPLLVQRAVAEGDRRITALLAESLGPLFRSAPTLFGPRATPDVLVSLFGAAVVPYLYTPLLDRLHGEESEGFVHGGSAASRRRAHLEDLAARLFDLPLRSQ